MMTEAEQEEAANRGFDLARTIAPMLDNQPVPVVFNTLGSLVEQLFVGLPELAPHEALHEFDNWMAYTKQRITDGLKGRMS